MTIQILTVHPSVVVVKHEGREFEIPADTFPTPPQVGQSWDLTVTHIPTTKEQVAKLNDYLTSA